MPQRRLSSCVLRKPAPRNSAWRPAAERPRASQATRACPVRQSDAHFHSGPARSLPLWSGARLRTPPGARVRLSPAFISRGARTPKASHRHETPLRPNQRMKLTRTYVKVDLCSMGRAAYPCLVRRTLVIAKCNGDFELTNQRFTTSRTTSSSFVRAVPVAQPSGYTPSKTAPLRLHCGSRLRPAQPASIVATTRVASSLSGRLM